MNKRILSLVLACVTALSLTVGGVFAWADNNQHKSNEFTGGRSERNDVVLVEDFQEPDDWQEGDEIDKKVSVKNTGEGQIYVRLQLKEYMEIAKEAYLYTDEYLLVDSDGRFVAANGAASLKAWLDNPANGLAGLVYDDSQIRPFTAYGDSEKYYLVTDASTNVNGKYGKQLLRDYVQDEAKSLVEGVARGSYDPMPNSADHHNLECLYTPHTWGAPPAGLENCGHGDDSEGYDGSGLGFHDYVEWTLGAPLITLTDWIAGGGEQVAAWILDDTSDEGWAYWGQALKPGESTAKLLEAVTLIKQPGGPFYYAIHVDMQAADASQLTSNFTGMPEEIEGALRGKTGFAISADKQTFTKNGTADGKITFSPAWEGEAIPLSDVTWSVVTMDGQAQGPYTRFRTPDTVAGTASPGVLTIGGGQPSGRLLVTAQYTPPGGAQRTQTFVITVK